MKLQKQKGKSS